MLSIGIAIALTLVGQDQSKSPAAKVLIEKMMNRYYSAQTLTGTIKLTVSTEAGSASLDTVLQYERPAKLYIRQQKNVANPDPGQPSKWLVTSDGTTFSYDIPNHKYESAPGLRLAEPVSNPRVKTVHTVATIYSAASKSIGDRSMPLDIAISGRDDLLYRRAQWLTFKVIGNKEVAGRPVSLVGGDYRPYAGAEAIGKYQMAITPEGDLLQYVEETNVAVGEGGNVQTVRITSQWDVNLVVGGKVDPGLFKVVLR